MSVNESAWEHLGATSVSMLVCGRTTVICGSSRIFFSLCIPGLRFLKYSDWMCQKSSLYSFLCEVQKNKKVMGELTTVDELKRYWDVFVSICEGGSPVDQRVPHAGGDGGGLCCVAQSEDALDDGQLCAGSVKATERTPVVDHHPRSDDITAPVHCTGLNRRSFYHQRLNSKTIWKPGYKRALSLSHWIHLKCRNHLQSFR